MVKKTRFYAGERTVFIDDYRNGHSWQGYNTDIADSARIAAETILTLVKGRPNDIHPLEWINRKYAEDPKWHLGVEAFFKQMLVLMETPS